MAPHDTGLIDQGIRLHLEKLGEIGAGTGGWSRLAFSAEENAAHAYARAAFVELGCKVFTDAFQNLYGTLEGESTKDSRPVMLGTHLDTVRNGGNYDGVVGFIVAVEAVRALLLSSRRKPAVQLAVFRAEESTLFKKACLGSRAAFLGVDEETLALSFEERVGVTVSLSQSISLAGGLPNSLGKATLDVSHFQAYFETHIEQARVLERRIGLDQVSDEDFTPPIIGIVTSIRAPQRCEWEVSGERSVVLLAKCVIAVEAAALLANSLGMDAVATVGRVENFYVGADKINAVPGRVEFPLRGLSEESHCIARAIGAQRGCLVEIDQAEPGPILRVIGTTDHSGGSPMGRENRRDALVAASEIVLGLPSSSVPTCSRIVFYTDVRSNSVSSRDFVCDLIGKTFESLEKLLDTNGSARVEMIRRTEKSDPLPSLSADLQKLVQLAASDEGLDFLHLPSGAGHDAMMAAIAGLPTAMMFIPSRKGLSHNPEEFSRVKDILAAVRVQARLLELLA